MKGVSDMKQTNNNYELGKQLIHNSDFSVKSVKTFMGREGHGVNANIYFKNQKIGDVIDSGNGGELNINYYIGDEWMRTNKDVDDFLNTLPKHTFKEKGYDFRLDEITRFDAEEMWNELINLYLIHREYKKDMRKVAVLRGDNVYTYNRKPSELGNKFRHNGDLNTLREIVLMKDKNSVILNELPESESFSIWYENVYNQGGN